MDTQELDKNIIKSQLNKVDMMVDFLEKEVENLRKREDEMRKREGEIVCDLEVLYKRKENLLTCLSGADFTASLLDDDWEVNGTLSLNTSLWTKERRKDKKKREEKFRKEWMKKNKKVRISEPPVESKE